MLLAARAWAYLGMAVNGSTFLHQLAIAINRYTAIAMANRHAQASPDRPIHSNNRVYSQIWTQHGRKLYVIGWLGFVV